MRMIHDRHGHAVGLRLLRNPKEPSMSVEMHRSVREPAGALRRVIASVASACLLCAALPMPAHAALVGTEQVLHADGAARAQIHAWLARAEVRRALLDNGVNLGQVQARVDALTDAEAADFAARIDHGPAGGDVLGILFAVFVILLITDILGLTKVFPFTRPIR
jgi:hypothetical protein